MIDTMRSGLNSQDSPMVGIFWYDKERDELIGVRATYADELQFNSKNRKTVKSLHHTTWPTVSNSGIRRYGSEDPIFSVGDYTMVPRGRVFEVQSKYSTESFFEVTVGSWIRDYPHVPKMIFTEFNLNSDIADIVIDRHWDIGNGQSEILLSEELQGGYIMASTKTGGTTFYRMKLSDIDDALSEDGNVWVLAQFEKYGLDALDLQHGLFGSLIIGNEFYLCETDGQEIEVGGEMVDPEEAMEEYGPKKLKEYIQNADDEIIQQYIGVYEINSPDFDTLIHYVLDRGYEFTRAVEDMNEFPEEY